MKRIIGLFILVFAFSLSNLIAQDKDPIIEAIVKEANENSQLENIGHELMDVVGPRLVGTPQMLNAHNWAIEKYKSWGIDAKKEKWGEF